LPTVPGTRKIIRHYWRWKRKLSSLVLKVRAARTPRVYYIAKNGELYVASGGHGTLRVYDGISELGDDTDNVRYDAHSGQILVGFRSGGLGLVDASGQKVRTIPLSSHPESFQPEESGSRIFRKRAKIRKRAKRICGCGYRSIAAKGNRQMGSGLDVCELPHGLA
jgi:hypothetical protein